MTDTMSSGSVLVTGATGNVGRAVAQHLFDLGQSVVSAARDESTQNVVIGTERRAFDFESPSGWPAAFAGIDRLFLLRPPALADASADFIAVQKMIYRVVRMNVSAFPNRSIRRLTGAPATTFAQFAEREKSAWTRSSTTR